MVLVFAAVTNVAAADFIQWGPTVPLETKHRASWARLSRLRNGDWLAAYAVFGNPSGTVIHVKRSGDRMRSWTYVTQVAEPGRQLDNANLLQLANGDVLLAVRSLVPKKSYRVQVYRSTDDGRSFRFLSVIEANETPNGSEGVGVWEPFLLQLPDNRVAAFYANEKHSTAEPAYSQVISERISADGGATWGEEILAVAEPGQARPGEPNVLRLPDNRYMLFYEVCGTEPCAGRFSVSADGVNWPGTIGAPIPHVYQNPQGLSLGDGTLVVTSNSAEVIFSRDSGMTWEPIRPAFSSSRWGALYQTGAREVALVTGTVGTERMPGQLLIRIGEIARARPVRRPKRSEGNKVKC